MYDRESPGRRNKLEHNGQHGDEDKIVLPADRIQCDGVHKGVEEERTVGGDPTDSEAARTKRVLPDLARVGGNEGCSGRVSAIMM
jgi:hypothetical protein